MQGHERPGRLEVPPEGFLSFAEFYPFYLGEHRNRICRRLHFAGTLAVILLVVMVLATGAWRWLLVVPVAGYGPAWIGHYGFEKNRPATFRYPLYSLAGDWVMFRDMCIGRIPF